MNIDLGNEQLPQAGLPTVRHRRLAKKISLYKRLFYKVIINKT